MTRRWARTSTSRRVESSVPPTGAKGWPQRRQRQDSAGSSCSSTTAGRWAWSRRRGPGRPGCWPRRRRVRGRRGQGGGGAGLGLAAEELLLAESELGAELFDLLFEERFALHGAVVQGLPV